MSIILEEGNDKKFGRLHDGSVRRYIKLSAVHEPSLSINKFSIANVGIRNLSESFKTDQAIVLH